MAATGGHLRGLTDRDLLLAEIRAARAGVIEAIEGLSEEQMSRPHDDGWSVKDHLAHLTVWDEMRFFEISRIARGGGAAFPETPDEAALAWVNEPTVAMRRRLPLSQVLADLEFARAMVLEMLAACPEDRLDQRLYEEIGIQGGAAHDIGHADAIRAWRKKEGI